MLTPCTSLGLSSRLSRMFGGVPSTPLHPPSCWPNPCAPTGAPPGNKVCYGKQCYFTTALICASGCAFAVVLGLIMARLTKRRYYVLYADIRTKKAR